MLNLSPCNKAYKKIKTFLAKNGAHRTSFLDKHVNAIIVDERKPQGKKVVIPDELNQSRVARMIRTTLEKTKSGSSSVKDVSKKWNIPVYDYRDILTWNIPPHVLQHPKKYKECNMKTVKAKKLKAPFIKVEDQSRSYRPSYTEMKTVPFIDFNCQIPRSPFETWYKRNAPSSSKEIHVCSLLKESASCAKEHFLILTVI